MIWNLQGRVYAWHTSNRDSQELALKYDHRDTLLLRGPPFSSSIDIIIEKPRFFLRMTYILIFYTLVTYPNETITIYYL